MAIGAGDGDSIEPLVVSQSGRREAEISQGAQKAFEEERSAKRTTSDDDSGGGGQMVIAKVEVAAVVLVVLVVVGRVRGARGGIVRYRQGDETGRYLSKAGTWHAAGRVTYGEVPGPLGLGRAVLSGRFYARLRRGFQEGETARGTVGGERAPNAAGSCGFVCVGRTRSSKSAKRRRSMKGRTMEMAKRGRRETIDAEEEEKKLTQKLDKRDTGHTDR